MPRIRTIKPEFFDDEDLGALPVAYRLGFIGLWCQADKAGRLEDRPVRLKARIFPFDDVDVDAMLSVLADKRFVIRYEDHGHRYLAVRSWGKHQRPRNDEDESQLPAPPFGSDDVVTEQSRGKERKGRERKGTEESAELLPHSTPDDSAVVAVFPCVGPDGQEWRLRREQVDEWKTQFPTIDVDAECRKALVWTRANPGRRKTRRGMPKFLAGWLIRATDGGRAVTKRPNEPASTRRVDDYDPNWARDCHERHGSECANQKAHRDRMARERQHKAAS